MKKVSLIGDSIRLGYQDAAKAELDGLAEVWSPEGNCMHSIHHLFNLKWYIEQPADLIHFNFGLWDCRRLGRLSSETAIPIDLYVRNLDFLISQIREETDATLVWATITPVLQDRYNARFSKLSDPCRNSGDNIIYNQAAAPILQKHEVLINDLYTFVIEQGVEEMVCKDGIHYTAEASQLLGRKVAEEIKHHL
ncbi:MAG TPA: hypothetical protein DEA90_11510 [Opitutae bacterium]|nr:hypothetical protein [Puniceicoccaceae bacterium]HBR94779.1 hypothetical protein [Opitutae bacterium]|tara:strand:+ start:21 stop:602 length:582 start_codon:yes stop_codon:yes gene_type:complete